MAQRRSGSGTPCGAPATPSWRTRTQPALWAAVACVLLASVVLPAGHAADTPDDTDKALRQVLRVRLPAGERLGAAARALKAKTWRDPSLGFRAGVSLLAVDEATAGWMIRRAARELALHDALRDEGVDALRARFGKEPPPDTAADARRAALGMVLGWRPEDVVTRLVAAWPPGRFVEAVLRDEFGDEAVVADGAAARAVLEARMPPARWLDEGMRDDDTRMLKGMDALVAAPEQSLPLLLHEARRAAQAPADGRGPRACRAIAALGQLGNRAATPVLRRCLKAPDGWVRHCAATALGDLGDPAAIPDLAWSLRRMSDEFRNRDQWDHPGRNATPITPADWTSTDYYVIDMATADALLRLGVPNAAGFLIAEKLNPRKANFRIRVLQDAVDALARAGIPLQGYNVDQGIPLRRAAFEKLSTWWIDHRGTDWLPKKVDEEDPGFVKASLALARKLQSNDARSFIITKRCCELIGPPMTPALLETLANARQTVARSELAKALGVVRDPRAVKPLLALLQDPKAVVRERTVLALGSYARENEAARDALLGALKSRSIGIRVAALKALVRAPRDPVLFAAVRAITPDDRDARIARTIIDLVQDGMTHWGAVEAGLNDPVRETRRTWWDLLRAALDLPAHLHDAQSPPDTPNRVRVQATQIEAARGRVPEVPRD